MGVVNRSLVDLIRQSLKDPTGTTEIYITEVGWMQVGMIEEYGDGDVWLVTPLHAENQTYYVGGTSITAAHRVRATVLDEA